MAEKPGAVAAVAGQEGDRVLLSLPMVGFPPGFKLRRGERVTVVYEPSGPAVRPLVRAIRTPQNLSRADSLEAEGQRLVLQDATLRTQPPREGEETVGYVAWVVEPGTAEGPAQVIAVRPYQPPR